MTSSSGTGNNVSRTPGYDLQPGQVVLNTWEVLEPLGRGGMGAVYRVYHRFLQKEMAMKTLRPDQVTDVNWKRFQTEAKAIAKLVHPNIIQIFDMGTAEEGQPFYTMELLNGQGLDEWIRYEPITAAQALTVFRQVATALAFAHERGIVHRDIKPANIVLTFAEENKPPVVKVVDFGIAKLGTENQGLTKEGEVFGSPLYMSPEQATGQKVDHRSDIYSFGCALYETLTGFPPFKGKSAMETMMMHLEKTPLPIERARPEIKFPPGLSAIVQMMLAKDPDERYSNASQIAQDLMQIERGMGEKVAYRLQTASQMVQEQVPEDTVQVTQRLTNAYGRAEREAEEEEEEGELEEEGHSQGVENGEEAASRPRGAGWLVVSVLGSISLCSFILLGAWYGCLHLGKDSPAFFLKSIFSQKTSLDDFKFHLDKEQVAIVQEALKLPKSFDPKYEYFYFPVSDVESLGKMRDVDDLSESSTLQACGLVRVPREWRISFSASSYLMEHPKFWQRFEPDDVYELTFQKLADDPALKGDQVAEGGRKVTIFHDVFGGIKLLTGLHSLDLQDTKAFSNSDLKTIGLNLKHLEKVVFKEDCAIGATDIENMPGLLTLRYLKLPILVDLSPVLEKLVHSTSLETLVIPKGVLTQKNVELLGKIENLRELGFVQCDLNSVSLVGLLSSKSLRRLNLSESALGADNEKFLFQKVHNLDCLTVPSDIHWSDSQKVSIAKSLANRGGKLNLGGSSSGCVTNVEAFAEQIGKDFQLPDLSGLQIDQNQLAPNIRKLLKKVNLK